MDCEEISLISNFRLLFFLIHCSIISLSRITVDIHTHPGDTVELGINFKGTAISAGHTYVTAIRIVAPKGIKSMPTLITTIEDFSPVIFYSGSGGNDWTAGTSSNDSSIDKYSDSSYTVTQIANASVSFTFSGTGVQLYGAERADHGLYQVTIDSRIYPPVNGKANQTEEVFQNELFQTAALENGLHTVTIVNMGITKLDIDFLTWETPIGQDQESLLSFTFQDSDPSFKYTPASLWTISPSNIGTFNGGSGHVTSTAGAFVEYTFTCLFIGAAVALFGPVGPQGAPYSVQLDNGPTTNYSSSKQFYQPQTMLFQAGNLNSGAHTVRLRSEAWNNSALTFAIDFAQVYSTPSLQPATPTLAAGSIVAIVFGVLLAFIFIAAGYLFYNHRRGMAMNSVSISPFGRDEYQSVVHSPQGTQPHTPLSPNYGWPAAGTSSVHHSKMINPEVLNTNSPFSPVFSDRKYSQNLIPTTIHSDRLSFEFSSIPEEGGSRQGIRLSGHNALLPSGAAPPRYSRNQSE